MRRATEANPSPSAKMYWSATETRATAPKTPATNKPKLPEVNDWPAGRRRTDGPSRCESEPGKRRKPTPKRIKVEADKKEFWKGLTFELTGAERQRGKAAAPAVARPVERRVSPDHCDPILPMATGAGQPRNRGEHATANNCGTPSRKLRENLPARTENPANRQRTKKLLG